MARKMVARPLLSVIYINFYVRVKGYHRAVTAPWVKVFWFFFTKKNALALSTSALECG